MSIYTALRVGRIIIESFIGYKFVSFLNYFTKIKQESFNNEGRNYDSRQCRLIYWIYFLIFVYAANRYLRLIVTIASNYADDQAVVKHLEEMDDYLRFYFLPPTDLLAGLTFLSLAFYQSNLVKSRGASEFSIHSSAYNKPAGSFISVNHAKMLSGTAELSNKSNKRLRRKNTQNKNLLSNRSASGFSLAYSDEGKFPSVSDDDELSSIDRNNDVQASLSMSFKNNQFRVFLLSLKYE